MSERVYDKDLIYCGFWVVLIGVPILFIAWVLYLIERNTHLCVPRTSL